MLFGSVILFLLIMVLFFLTLFRPGFGRSVSPRGWVILGGVVMPVPIILVLLAYAFWQGEQLTGYGPSGTVRIEARAWQWGWEFRYPDFPDARPTLNLLHIPAGQPVEITAISEDVIHGFWIPRLGGKVDVIPGHTNTIRLLADREGVYGGLCAEFCGDGHTGMAFEVRAYPPTEFRAILDTRSEPTP